MRITGFFFKLDTLDFTKTEGIRVIKKITLILLSTLIACEACLRIKDFVGDPAFIIDGKAEMGEHYFRDISTIPWALKPDINVFIERPVYDIRNRVITDEDGHRYLPASLADGKKVLLMGDSVTMGNWLDVEKTFGNLIAQEMAVSGLRTINLGVPNYGPAEYVKAFLQEVKKYGASQIESGVIFFNLATDFADFDKSYWAGMKAAALPINVPVKNYFTYVNGDGDLKYFKFPLMNIFRFVPYLHFRIYSPVKNILSAIVRRLSSQEKPALAIFFNNFYEYCQQKNIKLFMVVIQGKTTDGQIMNSHLFSALRKDIKIPILDMTKNINSSQAAGKEPYLNDRSHFNAYGSKLIASSVVPFLLGEK